MIFETGKDSFVTNCLLLLIDLDPPTIHSENIKPRHIAGEHENELSILSVNEMHSTVSF